MAEFEFLLTAQRDGVRTITLNRPDCLNAFNDEMSFELQQALKDAERDPEVRCLLLTGAGRGFCAGQDLNARGIQGADGLAADEQNISEEPPHLGNSIRERYSPIVSRLRSMEKPVIAAINGVAAGAGASLAFACDIRIAARSVRFIQAFVRVGLIPDTGACWLLPRLVGMGRAFELAMTGDPLDAETALQWGLVNRVVPEDELEDTAFTWALRLALGPTKALGLIKRAFNRGMSLDLESYLECEAQLQEVAGRSADYREGVGAFLEKRPPSFSGK